MSSDYALKAVSFGVNEVNHQLDFMLWSCFLIFGLGFPICSGDAGVQTSQALEGLFVDSGYNPFKLIKDSIK